MKRDRAPRRGHDHADPKEPATPRRFLWFVEHHRNIPYRPPRPDKRRNAEGGNLYFRFVRRYLGPFKWPLFLCMALVGVNAGSVYLMPFYTRYVVDDILLVSPGGGAAAADTAAAGAGASGHAAPARRVWADDHAATGAVAPERKPGTTGAAAASAAARQRPPGAGTKLIWIFGIYIATVVILNFVARAAARRQIAIGQQVSARLRDDMHERILQLQLAYHKSQTPGRLLARIMSDVSVVQEQMMATVLQLTSSLSGIVLGAIILFSSDWRVGLIAFTVTPLYAVVYDRSRGYIRFLSRELRHTNSCLYGLVSQKFDAVKAIQAYGRTLGERLNFHRLSACFFRDQLCQQRQSAAVGQVSGVISIFGTLGVFLYGAAQVLDGEMSLGKMLYCYSATANLFAPVLVLTHLGVMFTNLTVVMNRLVEVLDEPITIAEAPDACDFPSPMRRGLQVRNVSFTYATPGEGEDEDGAPTAGTGASATIISNLSLEIAAGQWICLMGPSGCGKSTLLYLLSRLYEPTGGEVTIDGVPLSKVRVASLRERMALVPQEAQLFKGTIRENISYGYPDASPAQIMAAAKAAEIHDLIMGMKVRYETVIGERGTSLSGGQRQRLSLARALLTDPEVLLLDDCTSALDADTERKIQDTLGRILVGKTAIIVSQRVSMARRCHRIYVLDRGQLAEAGTHAELVAQRGFYSRLVAQQTE